MKKLSIVAMAILLASCTTQTYIVSDQVGASVPSHDKMQHFFAQGIVQQQEVDAQSICNGSNNVTKIQTQQTFLNGLLNVLTQGIYTPRDMRVYCK